MSQSDAKTHIQTAMALLDGQGAAPSKRDFETAYTHFKAALSVPFAKAKLAVLTAVGCGTDQDIETAKGMFLEAVMSGFPPLLRDMAVILDGASIGADGLSAALLRRAAGAGDKTAQFLWAETERRGSTATPGAIDTEVMKQALSSVFDPGTAAFVKETLSDAHPIYAARPTLAPLQCDYLRAISAPLMQPSKVAGASGAARTSYRTSDGAVLLPANMEMPVLQILWRLSATAGTRPDQGEFLSLLRYHPGQEYLPHHDYLPEGDKDYAQVSRCGQRKLTVLTYLNGGYQGGATHFPELDVRFKGGVGDSLVFANTDEAGRPMPQSLHAGEPVETGEKWLATLWVREKRFWPW